MSMRTKDAIRYISNYALFDLKQAPLFVGAPGIGKSSASYQANLYISKAVLTVAEKLEREGRGKGLLDIPNAVVEVERQYELPNGCHGDKLAMKAVELIEYIKGTNVAYPDIVNQLVERLEQSLEKYKVITLEDTRDVSKPSYVRALGVADIAVMKAFAYCYNPFIARHELGFAILFDESVPLHVYSQAMVFVDMNIATKSIVQLAGVPYVISDTTRRSSQIPPSWAVALKSAKFGFMNIDEFTNVEDPEVMSAVYALVLNRRVGDYEFNKPVVATGNTKDTSSLVQDIPAPLTTGRFVVLRMKTPYIEEWNEYMVSTYGEKWFNEAYPVLRLLTRHSKLYEKMKEEKPDVALTMDKLRKILLPVEDAFLPPDRILAEKSSLPPGEPSYPTPRFWTHFLVDLYKVRDIEYVKPILESVSLAPLVFIFDKLLRKGKLEKKVSEVFEELTNSIRDLLSGNENEAVAREIVASLIELHFILQFSAERGNFDEVLNELREVESRSVKKIEGVIASALANMILHLYSVDALLSLRIREVQLW